MRPFEFEATSALEVVLIVLILLLQLLSLAICFSKHRMLHGMLGILIPPLAWYAALRLAKPGSPWARRFYGERNPRKQARAGRRFLPGRRTDRFKERVRTAIGGSTERDYLAKIGERE